MEGILLPICSLFFSGLMCYVYFSKERVDLLENKLVLITGKQTTTEVKDFAKL